MLKHIFISIILLMYPALIFALGASSIYTRVSESVYLVGQRSDQQANGTNEGGKPSQGSAVAITDTLLASNCHVFKKSDRGVILLNHQSRRGAYVTVVRRDEKRDLCIIKLEEGGLKPVRIRNSRSLLIGEEVYAIGNPKGNERTLSKGIISKIVRNPNDNGVDVVLTDNVLAPGSSGGGLFDSEGYLVGITKGVMKIKDIGATYAYIIAGDRVADSVGLNTVVINPSQIKRKIIKSAAGQTLKLLDSFGRHGVRLIQDGEICYISLNGIGSNEEIENKLIWYPSDPNTFYITRDIQDEFSVHGYVKMYLNADKSSPVVSQHTLTLGDSTVYLLGLIGDGEKHKLYKALLLEDPTSELIALKQIRLDFNDGLIYRSRIIFDLDGFDEAFKSSKLNCSSTN